MKLTQRESSRIKDVEKRKILDDASRRRRARRALDALEADNFHDDPHADLVMSKKVPKFQDTVELRVRKKKERSTEYYKQKYRKGFQQMMEEDRAIGKYPVSYSEAAVGPTEYPARMFCCVCGFFSKYTCVPCGSRYCSARCLATHLDTRCLKWVG